MLALLKSLSVALAEKKPNEPSITAEKPKPKTKSEPCHFWQGFFLAGWLALDFSFFPEEDKTFSKKLFVMSSGYALLIL
jgi:hypothetical protein